LWLPLGFQALNLSVGQKGQATTWVWNKRREPSNLFMWKTAWRTKLLTTRNGHGKSGWSPIGCEGLVSMLCENRVGVSGWSPCGCEGFRTNLNIPNPLPTTLVFR
jgi:hypothetical protein